MPTTAPTVDALNPAQGIEALPVVSLEEPHAWQRAFDRWQSRLLLAATLVGSLLLYWFVNSVAALPVIDVELRSPDANLITAAPKGETPALLVSIDDAQGRWLPLDVVSLHDSARWIVDDASRRRFERQRDGLAQAALAGPLRWTLAEGRIVSTTAQPLGFGRLGVLFWVAIALALMVYVVCAVSLLTKPHLGNLLLTLTAIPQVGNFMLIATESALGPWAPPGFSHLDHVLRSVFDLTSAAAMFHTATVFPRRTATARWLPWLVWIIVAALSVGMAFDRLPNAWWWTHAFGLAAGVAAIAHHAWVHRHHPNPRSLSLLRFGLLMLLAYGSLSVALWLSSTRIDGQARQLESFAAMVWSAFMGIALVATPFMAKRQALTRDFAMLAGISTMATALDLAFIAVFALSPVASLSMAMFLSIMTYAALRQRMLDQLLRNNIRTTERLFERVYRIARDVEAHPQALGHNVVELMQELFEPTVMMRSHRAPERTTVMRGGSTLIVPLLPPLASRNTGALVLRYAQHGNRLFNRDDALLCDRVLEQLVHAVAFDQAVERGRREERERLAQDLHDDIGARLLTLMYTSKDPDVENYIRHTIQELKTLTRGLAAREHPLEHSAAEWRADVDHRLRAAHAELSWNLTFDRNIHLSVMQWSALTRILRELVTNTIAHGRATKVTVEGQLNRGILRLSVADNGVGRDPHRWSHGLGMGGVRKRVKQLQGTVQWADIHPRGIVCRIEVPLDAAASTASISKRQLHAPKE